MKLNPVRTGRSARTSVFAIVVLAAAFCTLAPYANAQAEPTNSAEPKPDTATYRTFYLINVAEKRSANDVVTDLRNMLPRARLFYVPSQYAISMHGSADDIQTAQKILSDIDRPHKTYRLTYSLTEMNGDEALGTRKVSLVALDSGDRVTIKQGDKVPIVTGTTEAGGSAQNSEVQYEDIGLMIEAAVEGSPDALLLSTRVAQSSVADQHTASGAGDPTFRQTVLDGVMTLVPGKPLVLGTLDIPGTTHREEVAVESELVR